MSKDFLSIIVENKKAEVAEAQKKISLDEIKKMAAEPVERRSFIRAMESKDTVNIIAEVKRASPSKGDIAIDLDPYDLADKYEKGGAACLSVLTDEKYFKGSFEDFRQARKAASLPMLRKDFLIDPYQVYESAVLGADCVLLIARILTPEQMKTLFDMATDLGIDSLVEIHSEKDLEIAASADARLIGINNRNLSSFETSLETATSLVRQLGEDQIPVAASGISQKEDIDLNLKAGINNFLIGESLAKADDTVALLKSFREVR